MNRMLWAGVDPGVSRLGSEVAIKPLHQGDTNIFITEQVTIHVYCDVPDSDPKCHVSVNSAVLL